MSEGGPACGNGATVRIVALDGSPARLQKIAEDIRAATPGFAVRLVEPPAADRQ